MRNDDLGAHWLSFSCSRCAGGRAQLVLRTLSNGAVRQHSLATTFDEDLLDYVDALQALVARPHASITQTGTANLAAVRHVREHWGATQSHLYARHLAEPLMSTDWASLLVSRCLELMQVPLAPLCIQKPGLEWGASLPWDLHPRVSTQDVRHAAAQSSNWPKPTPSSTTVLIGADLGETSLPLHELAVGGLAMASAIHLGHLRARALSACAAKGFMVLPLTLDHLLDSIEGRNGADLMLVGRVVDRPTGDVLVCDDADVDLKKLRSRLDTFRSPLRAVDLCSCNSSEALSAIFHALGVTFVQSRVTTLHPAWIYEHLRRIAERNLLDGTRGLQHAWIWAAHAADNSVQELAGRQCQ